MTDWIKCSDKMPPSGKRIIFYWKSLLCKGRTSIGWWLDQYHEEAFGDALEGDVDYHEEKDMHFIPKGWYEWGWETEYSGDVDPRKVTHWMELPGEPGAKEAPQQ